MATTVGYWTSEAGRVVTPCVRGFGSFVKAVAKGDDGKVGSFYGPVEKAAMEEATGVRGGYITPLEFSLALLRSLEEHSFIRQRATIVPMSTGEAHCPILNAASAQAAGTTPFFGGMKFTWNPAEGTALTQGEPTFRQGSLRARDLIGELILSNQFFGDIGPAGEEYLVRLFGEACAWYEQYAFLRGTGGDGLQPVGMLNAACASAVTRAGGSSISIVDVGKMGAKMIPSGWIHAIWMCSPTAIEKITQISGFQANANPLGVEQGCIGTLLARPVFVTQALPALGTKGDLMFVDPSLYAIGDRQDFFVDASPHPLFRTAQTVFRVWRRVDGIPMLSGAVTLADASSTASSIVVLE